MQKIAKIIAFIGIFLVVGAGFLIVDALATDERRAAVEQKLDEMANRYDNADSRRARRADKLGGMASFLQTMKHGIFFSAPVDLADVLPLVPQGWETRVYTRADGEAITGDALPTEGFTTTTTQDILRRFALSKNIDLDVAQTYVNGDRMVAIHLESRLDRFRTLKKGETGEIAKLLSPPAQPSGLTVFGRIDGLAILQHPQFSQDDRDRRYPVAYRRYTLDIGRVVQGEIITNAADADLVALFSTLGVTLVETALPRPTDRYVPEAGFAYLAGDAPSTEPPEPTVPFRAYALRQGGELTEAEREILALIAQGKERTQSALKASKLWTDDITPPVQEIVALLPEN